MSKGGARQGMLGRLRAGLRGIRWRLRELGVRNPPLPPRVESMLFVCKGNICRSPFAGYLAARLAAERGLALRSSSAGLVPSRDGRCPDDAIEAARRYGVDLTTHCPAQLDEDVIAAHDLVIVMDADQWSTVRERWPAYRDRVVLLALFDAGPAGAAGAYDRLTIADPFDRGPEAFRRCYDRLSAAIPDLLDRLPRPPR